jgi:hypothetical protein
MRRCAAFLCLLASVGCGDKTDETPDSGLDDEAERRPSLDAREIGLSTVRRDARALENTAELKAVFHSFIEDDPTLDLAASASQNADNIAARISSETSSCAAATVTHAGGSASVAVDFGQGCALGSTGVTVSGSVSLVVTVTQSPAKVSVAFTFSSLSVGGYVLSGTATISTTDLVSYATLLDLTVADLGSMKLDGTLALSGTSTNTLAATVAGSGTAELSSGETSQFGSNGWNCVSSGPASYTIASLHRTLSACYADSGTITLTKGYSCKKTVRQREVTGSASATVVVTWSSQTASTGTVNVSITTNVAGTSTMDTMSAELPAYGECP